MQPTTATTRLARRRASGFTLVEILISLGIFLIGMTAIVSLFPAAAILQRETTQAVIGDMAAESARAIINANGLIYEPPSSGDTGDLDNYHPTAGSSNTDVVPLQSVMGTVPFMNRFPAAVRSYPTGLLNGMNVADCDLHWVPFLQDLAGDPSNPNWVMRLYLVRSDSRATYPLGNVNDANPNDANSFPKVRSVDVTFVVNTVNYTFIIAGGTDLEAGDTMMDSNGNTHVVTEVNGANVRVLNPIPLVPATPTKLWYAPRGGSSNSPTERIVTVEVNLGS